LFIIRAGTSSSVSFFAQEKRKKKAAKKMIVFKVDKIETLERKMRAESV
jgi:hypothetical protein